MGWWRAAAAVPPLAFLAVFFVYPVATIVGRGFDLATFGRLASDAHLREVAWFTLWQAAASTALTVVCALPAAHVIGRYRFPFRTALRTFVTVPFVLPTVVVGAAFLALARSGGPLSPLRSSVWLVLAAHVFFNYGLVVRIVSSAWERLDHEPEDAARTLGASSWRTFSQITLPQLWPAIAGAASLVFLFTVTAFGTVLILGGARRSTVEVEIYRRTAHLLDLPSASALAVAQLMTVGALLAVSARLTAAGATATARVRTRSRRPPRGWARWWVSANAAFAVLVVGGPLMVLVGKALDTGDGLGTKWFAQLGENTRQSTLFVPPVEAVRNSVVFGLVAALIALAMGGLTALLVAGRSARRPQLPRVVDAVVMLPLATSAVTLGFGFLISLDRPPLDLRASPALIPIAHALVGTPFVVRILVPALRSVDHRLRDAAAVLGASRARVSWEVDFPLVVPAIVVAVAFAFVVSLGEFGATIFIARPDYPTLPIAVYRLLGQPGAANQGQAMAMSVVLLAASAAAVACVDRARVAVLGDAT